MSAWGLVLPVFSTKKCEYVKTQCAAVCCIRNHSLLTAFIVLSNPLAYYRAVKYWHFRNDSLSISGASSARCTLAQL